MDGEGEELDRDAFQRDGAVFWASPDGGSVLLGAGGKGEPHPFGPQPRPESGPPGDGGGGALS